jgi:uncharacterized protein YbjT (DUF2867 family)
MIEFASKGGGLQSDRPMVPGKHLVLVGATGMVGGCALELALAHPAVASVTSIGRRATGVAQPRLREVLHADFGDCRPLESELCGVDVALYCLGVYTGAQSDAEFRRVTVDFTAGFARALHASSPGAAVCLLSAEGADPGERSRIPFRRYKGMAENALLRSGLARVHLFRPGYIHPVVPRVEPNVFYRILRLVYPFARRLWPGVGIPSVDVARAMLAVGLDESLAGDGPAIERAEIRRIASRAPVASLSR